MSYLLQEEGDKLSLEDGTGFLLLEEIAIAPSTTRTRTRPISGTTGSNPSSGVTRAGNAAGRTRTLIGD